MKSRFGTRRDMCHFVGKRAGMLTPGQSAKAWYFLGRHVEAMGEMDIPKFLDLIATIRAATIAARRKKP